MTQQTMGDCHVIIVGAGLAGLASACNLTRRGIDCTLLEAGDDVGGRVRTDRKDGFLLDRGFQVLLAAYPECRKVLDYDALRLCEFEPGVLVFTGEKFEPLIDASRRPLATVKTLMSKAATVIDEAKMLRLRRDVSRPPVDALFARPETTTRERLEELGFSERVIERFFRPFIGGTFLDPDLLTTRRMFDFVYRMFTDGPTAVPSGGMGAIPHQILAQIPDGTVRLNTSVATVEGRAVVLESGERLEGDAVVIATSGPAAHRLLDLEEEPPAMNGSTTVYFATDKPPVGDPILMLNGTGKGLANSVTVLSNVAPSYAPEGQALIAVSILGVPDQSDGILAQTVRQELGAWFDGASTEGWRHLATYRIPDALPAMPPGLLDPPQRSVRIGEVFVCGDWRDNGSLNGALVSGRRCAEAVTAHLKYCLAA